MILTKIHLTLGQITKLQLTRSSYPTDYALASCQVDVKRKQLEGPALDGAPFSNPTASACKILIAIS